MGAYTATIDRALLPTKNENIAMYRGVVLPNPMRDYLSYGNQVFHIRGIATAPSGVESTSLAFVFGLDLFYNLVQPAGGYDILAEDFNFPLLLLSGLGAFLGVVFGEWYSARKSLSERWA